MFFNRTIFQVSWKNFLEIHLRSSFTKNYINKWCFEIKWHQKNWSKHTFLHKNLTHWGRLYYFKKNLQKYFLQDSHLLRTALTVLSQYLSKWKETNSISPGLKSVWAANLSNLNTWTNSLRPRRMPSASYQITKNWF